MFPDVLPQSVSMPEPSTGGHTLFGMRSESTMDVYPSRSDMGQRFEFGENGGQYQTDDDDSNCALA